MMILFVALIVAVMDKVEVQAKAIKVKEPSFACKSNKYIYYTYFGGDLMRLNTKTNKQKVILEKLFTHFGDA